MATHDFRGHVAVVTGAAGVGIGIETATRLAAGGAHVVVWDVHERRTHAARATIAETFPDVEVVSMVVDVADRAAVSRGLREVRSALGPVSLLVNSAAINVQGSIFDFDPADWDRVVGVNLTGAWNLARDAMPQMRERGGGAIVNVSSLAAELGGLGKEGPYAATKAAMNALTRSWAHEGGPYGIRANTVTMGAVAGTKFMEKFPALEESNRALSPLGRLPHARDVAGMIAFLLSDDAGAITGETFSVSSGAYMRP